MKIIAELKLLVFVGFLVSPPIITITKRVTDKAPFYGFYTEERTQKEIKAIISFDSINTTAKLSQLNCKLIFQKIASRNIKVFSKISISPSKQT